MASSLIVVNSMIEYKRFGTPTSSGKDDGPLEKVAGYSAVGSALRSGRRGRQFESGYPDHDFSLVNHVALRYTIRYGNSVYLTS